jgi:hypothetical protein
MISRESPQVVIENIEDQHLRLSFETDQATVADIKTRVYPWL